MRARPEEFGRVPFLKRPLGYGTVGSLLTWLLAIVIAVFAILGRLDLIDPKFS